jgi:uncharacterized protein YbjT (DUF2867 family)
VDEQRKTATNPVFITGGTGYIGRPLISLLLARGHAVVTLVRPGSEGKVPPGCVSLPGDALDARTFQSGMPTQATVVHLVGTPHPNPSKAAEFRSVDLASIRATAAAATSAQARHLVYVSVAHPAPVMREYIAVRQEGESLVEASGIPATILRPWYVLGPGHRWPYLLVPIYAVLRLLPATRSSADRLGLVTREAMVAALAEAVASPPAHGMRVMEVAAIRGSLRHGIMKGSPRGEVPKWS